MAASVTNGKLQSAAGQANHLRAYGDTALVERLDGDLVAFSDLAHYVLARHAAVVQDQLAGRRGANAEFVLFLADLESRKIPFDEKRRNAAVSRAGVRIRK